MKNVAFKRLYKKDIESATYIVSIADEESEFWIFRDELHSDIFHYMAIAQYNRLETPESWMKASIFQFANNIVYFQHASGTTRETTIDENWDYVSSDALIVRLKELFKEDEFYKDLEKTLNE